jgi:hypothetical protein
MKGVNMATTIDTHAAAPAPPDGIAAPAPLSRIYLASALGGFAFLACFFIGFWPLAHFLPGHDPSASAEQIAQLYRENTMGIRIGMMFLMFGGGFYLMFITGVSAVIRQMEGASTYLSQLQFAGGVSGSIYLFTPTIFWGITAFRPERAPELTLLLNDASWLLLISAVPPFLLQSAPLAFAILLTRNPSPIFPRWFAYLTLWGDLIYVPGVLAFFFKTGPFAWNGLFPYWLPFFVYGGWITLLCFLIMKAVKRDQTGR